MRFRKLAAKAASVVTMAPLGPEAVVVQRAEYDAVLVPASRLGHSDREVLKLAAWEGLSHREIAEVFDCSVAAVDQRLHRAKQRLARHYHAMHSIEVARHAAGGERS